MLNIQSYPEDVPSSAPPRRYASVSDKVVFSKEKIVREIVIKAPWLKGPKFTPPQVVVVVVVESRSLHWALVLV